MTIETYIEILERYKRTYGPDMLLKVQTLTHRFDAEMPVVRQATDITTGKDVNFLLLNP